MRYLAAGLTFSQHHIVIPIFLRRVEIRVEGAK